MVQLSTVHAPHCPALHCMTPTSRWCNWARPAALWHLRVDPVPLAPLRPRPARDVGAPLTQDLLHQHHRWLAVADREDEKCLWPCAQLQGRKPGSGGGDCLGRGHRTNCCWRFDFRFTKSDRFPHCCRDGRWLCTKASWLHQAPWRGAQEPSESVAGCTNAAQRGDAPSPCIRAAWAH